MKPVLLIIDMLNDFFIYNSTLSSERNRLVENINSLIHIFRSNKLSIIWVRQEFAPDLSDAFREMKNNNISITIAGTLGCEILSDLHRNNDDYLIIKNVTAHFIIQILKYI